MLQIVFELKNINTPGKLLFCYSLSTEESITKRVANQITAFAVSILV